MQSASTPKKSGARPERDLQMTQETHGEQNHIASLPEEWQNYFSTEGAKVSLSPVEMWAAGRVAENLLEESKEVDSLVALLDACYELAPDDKSEDRRRQIAIYSASLLVSENDSGEG